MRKKITEKQIEMIKTLNEMGVLKKQICEITGLSDKTVYRIITNQRDQYLEYWRNRRNKLKEQEEQKKQDEAVQTVIKTQTETKAETAAQSNTISDEALYNVMKNAVLDAMNQALAQNMSNLRGMVLGAIRTSQM